MLLLLAGLVALCANVSASAETQVDLELALTVDVSLSMDLDEQRLQREGYVAAFRDPLVLSAIKTGSTGRIAVTYIEWAGATTQITVMPWTLIDGTEAAARFAAALEAKPISRFRMTSISGALSYAAEALEFSPYKGTRRVIDVSGDGPNNSGPLVVPVRDRIVNEGIVINGLPILVKDGGPNSAFDIPNLDQYYAECVIGGTGAFSIPIHKKEEFAAAIRQKLVLEISGLAPARSARIIPTQTAGREDPADCQIGEKLWQRYMNGGFR